MKLAVPLRQSQIDAANKLHAKLQSWTAIDSALGRLRQAFPTFGIEETLLKAAAVNSLYRTRVSGLYRVSQHVHGVLASIDRDKAGTELVEILVDVPPDKNGDKPKRYHSFASKFVHFFISDMRFPIYDSYANEMVRWHLGPKSRVTRNDAPYEAFVENLERLVRYANIKSSSHTRELDRYLWIAGQLRAEDQSKLSAEIKNLFDWAASETLSQIRGEV